MKKLIVFLLAILVVVVVAILFTSCEEQAGVYKPKKKIFKVYKQYGADPEYLVEEWKWNGKRLSSITYYYKGEFLAEEEFIYEGNKIVKIIDDNGLYAEYIYADKQFKKINFFDSDDILRSEITFQYKGKKISTITIYGYNVCKNVISMIERSFMGKLLSEKGMKIVAEKLANQSKDTFVFYLSYDGENLTSISGDGYDATIYSDYDTHSNIWYNFYPFTYYHSNFYNVFSKNNPGKETVYYGESFDSIIYNYTYDGDSPGTIQKNYFNESGELIHTERTRIEYN
ncbi:MAG TPA: hypothetical protein PLH70_01175 [Bacteroidales bacterium]|nr:hypothetical protein [Bacteroidales bacterium]HOH21806.1 hypothetical protein [Bacteroidales bacterium]HPZ02702.1 hypothetical protein [Bacteroidales bacterium]HQB74398.1 hypothetical protein [Bacteroidales bacterium]